MSLQLTPRDLLLFEKLSHFGALSTRQCESLVFPETTRTTVLRRIRLLEEGKLIRRSKGLSDGMAVWFLTPQGTERLGGVYNPVRIPGHQLTHDMLLNDVRISLEGVGLGENWIAERDLRRQVFRHSRGSDEPLIVPDAIFTEVTRGKTHAIGVELEIQAKSPQRYEKIFKKYARSRNLALLWYFVPRESFGQRLLRYWEKETHGNNPGWLSFSLIPEILKDPANARVFRGKSTPLVKSFFDLKQGEGAQGGAQGLSTPAA